MSTAPAFWWRAAPTLAATLLRPLGTAYGAATAVRMGGAGLTLPAPVICVGNLVAGGAGKTPTALALAKMLSAAGHRPAFLSRGYGRTATRSERRGVLRVDPARHGAAETGDEPLLLAAVAPAYVSIDRVAAGRRALTDGATVLLLDDGLQNPALRKTASIAVVDGVAGVGNGLCIPAGPLRAPLTAQWPHVAALCLIGEGAAGGRVARAAAERGLPVWRAHLAADGAAVAALRGKPLYGFAGIGRPTKFFATLEDCGLDLRGRHAFPDHHRFSADDLAGLIATARRLDATLVTTAKDRVRLPAGFPAETLPITLRFDEADTVEQWLGGVARAGSASRI